MNKLERIKLVSSVVSSLENSISLYYEEEEVNGCGAFPGYNIGVEHSKTSIIRRCRVAREELMNIIKSLED